MPNWIRLGPSMEIEEGRCKVYNAAEGGIAVFRIEGVYHAIANTCVHMGGPLSEGDLAGHVVTCPWHHWSYDVRTGKTTMSEAVGVKSFPVELRGEDVFVDIA